MALERCGGGQRCLLHVLNVLVLAMGVALIVVGVWIYMDRDSGQFVDSGTHGGGSHPAGDDPAPSPVVVVPYRNVSNSDGVFSVLPFCLIGMGSCSVLFTLMAFAGVVCQSRALLGICFILQLLVFIAAIGVAVYLYIEKDEIDVDKGKLYPFLKASIETAVKEYHRDRPSKQFMDAVQQKYECCGATNGGGDYAPIMPLPCDIIHSMTPCVPLYEEEVLSRLGLKEFFWEKINMGFALSASLAALLIVLQILTLLVCCSFVRNE